VIFEKHFREKSYLSGMAFMSARHYSGQRQVPVPFFQRESYWQAAATTAPPCGGRNHKCWLQRPNGGTRKSPVRRESANPA